MLQLVLQPILEPAVNYRAQFIFVVFCLFHQLPQVSLQLIDKFAFFQVLRLHFAYVLHLSLYNLLVFRHLYIPLRTMVRVFLFINPISLVDYSSHLRTMNILRGSAQLALNNCFKAGCTNLLDIWLLLSVILFIQAFHIFGFTLHLFLLNDGFRF